MCAARATGPLVSILINNYNYARDLEDAVSSALAQDYAHVEVVVVDDGSTDGSREILEQFRDRVRLVFQPNGGQAAAFNAGFAASTGEIICFLDADDRFRADKARVLTREFAAHPEIEWCFHPLSTFGAETTSAPRPSYPTNVEIDVRAEMRNGRLRLVPPATTGLSFRRTLLSRLLPMPVEIRITSDNYLKFAALGTSRGIFLGEALAAQRLHDSNAYTGRGKRSSARGRIAMLTADCLRNRHPELRRFANGLFARGLVSALLSGGLDAESREMAERYRRGASRLDVASVALRGCIGLLREVAR